MQQLFIVTATGQNIANLPPILELASPGDKVIWLESPQARTNQWTKGANRVLQKYGLHILQPVSIEQINDPFRIAQACTAIIQLCRKLNLKPLIVANGGTKLSPFGPYSAFYDLEPTIVYGADRPAELWIFPRAFRQRPEIRPYQRHQLDLDDILTVANHQATNKNCIWPVRNSGGIEPAGLHPGYQFEAEVARRVVALLNERQGYGVVRSAWMNVKISKAFSEPRASQPPETKTKPRKKKKGSGSDLTDWDVVLVLKNAVLIHLECKSGARSTRDLLGRTAILHRASSQLAQMFTCIPFNLGQGDATRRTNQLLRYRQILTQFESVGLKLLPVTQGFADAACPIPSFESELEKALLAYQPNRVNE
jgi:hypothetical protein